MMEPEDAQPLMVRAVLEAVDEVGLGVFFATSLFGSNEIFPLDRCAEGTRE